MKPGLLWLYKVMTFWLPESRGFGWKRFWLRLAGARIGENVRIYTSASFYGNGILSVGDDVHIGSGVKIMSTAPACVRIGSCVDIGPDVLLVTGAHEIDLAGSHLAGHGTSKSIKIGDGCWLGARSLVLGGVELCEKTLVAAGAVVRHSVLSPKSLVAGVPAATKKVLG